MTIAYRWGDVLGKQISLITSKHVTSAFLRQTRSVIRSPEMEEFVRVYDILFAESQKAESGAAD